MGNTLDRALEHPNNTIPELIGVFCGVTARAGTLICDPRPGHEEENPSFSINEDGTLFNRFGDDGLGGSAFGFLMSLGMTKRDTALELIRRADLENEDGAKSYTRSSSIPKAIPAKEKTLLEKAKKTAEKWKPLTAEEQAQLSTKLYTLEPGSAALLEVQRRGLAPLLGHGLQAFELKGGNLAFEVSGPDGEPWAVKMRRTGELKPGEARYQYISTGHGGAPWLSPGYGGSSTVWFNEGEFNAMAAHLAFKTHGVKVDVQGIAGAEAVPYLIGLEGKEVYVYADGDAAGDKAREHWASLAVQAGATEVYLVTPLRKHHTLEKYKAKFSAQQLEQMGESGLQKGFESQLEWPEDFCDELEQARKTALSTGIIDENDTVLNEEYGVCFRSPLEGIEPDRVTKTEDGFIYLYSSQEAKFVKTLNWLTESLINRLRRGMEDAEPFTLEPEPEAQQPSKPKGKSKKADGNDEDGDDDKKKPASTRLLEHTEAAGVELWHDTDQNPYMSVPERREDGSSGRLTFRLPSSKARSWLEGLFYRTEHKAIAAMAIQEALGVLKSKAIFDGETYPAGVRILALEGLVYLDLGTPGLEVVEINKGGWIVRSSLEIPVRFWRPAGLKALPLPTKGGSLLELRKFLNTDERGFVLVVAWLTAALSGRKPYPVLAFSGEQGTGKSTASRVCRDLLDPNTAGLRSAPKNERDLFISAKNGHVLSFENLSVIGPELSDSMCRMATGGGFATRTLYADDEESLFDAARPIVLNGIPELATRPDLADRTLSATLERIDDKNRMDEATFWTNFEGARVGILGALCTAVSTYLRNWDSTRLELKPRMADFARLVVSAESALPWNPGEFLNHYSAARADLAASTLEGDEVAAGVAQVLEERGWKEWEGTADALLKELKVVLKFEERAPKSFPPNARALSSHLTRIAPALRQTDIVVEKERTNNRRAIILRHLRHAPLSDEGKTLSESTSKGGDAKGDAKYQGGQADEGKTPSGTTQEGGDAKGDANLGGDAKGDAKGPGDAKVTQEEMFASPEENPFQTTRLGFAEGPVTQVTQNLPRSTFAKVKRTYDGGDD